MRHLTADYIFPVDTPPIKNGVVSIKENGEIVAVQSKEGFNNKSSIEPEYHKGIITPGFVNAHCHLELSHLKGKIAKKTGLVNFIIEVQKFRNTSSEEIIKAMLDAEAEMLKNGIVAVGDISNTAVSFPVKSKSKLYYHTFIELLGFNPENALSIFAKGQELQTANSQLPTSLTAHAPYSTSNALLREISTQNNILSIHFRESKEELRFLKKKEGDFLKLYETFGINIDFYEPNPDESLKSYLQNIKSGSTIQLVHNTYIPENDLAEIPSKNILYWCLCPRANLYIEDRLSDIDKLLKFSDYITIGTDSLASNNQLNILSELQLIQASFSKIPLTELIKWATLNGANYLGISERFGSITKGKKPGLNLISELDVSKQHLSANSKVKRLI